MNKVLFLASALWLFVACTTKYSTAVVKDMRIDTVQVDESAILWGGDTTIVVEQESVVEQMAKDSMKKSRVSPKRIYHEPPSISADSLAVIRALWDSIISNPLLGYKKIYTQNENGKQTMVYVQAEAETVLLGPFDGRRKTSRPLYWEGSAELPANRGVENSSDVLYSWVDNMPNLTITYDEFIKTMAGLKELFAIKSNVKSKVRFVVEADGSITNAHIIESSTSQMNQLALIVSNYILKYTRPTHRKAPCRVVMELWI